jgi:GDP-L-fucose synthase
MEKILVTGGGAMNKDDKIYVSGHTGMVGSAIMRKLRTDGYVNIVTRTHSELDLVRQADVEAFFKQERPEYVFHIATKTGGVMQQKEHPVEYLHEGTLITLNVLNAAHIYGAKGVVYLASANIYPEDAPQPMSEDLLQTGRPPFFLGGYALSKTVGIKFCESVHRQFGKKFIAAVLPAVYGLGDYGTTVLPMLADKFANAVVNNEQTVTIWGTGNGKREFINSADLSDALLFLMDNCDGGQHINVGSGDEHSIRELAELLKEISGFKGELVFDTTKPESAGRQFLDSSKLRSLGWQPTRTFREGLKEVYREHLQRIANKGE